jgi:hypothetical protein
MIRGLPGDQANGVIRLDNKLASYGEASEFGQMRLGCLLSSRHFPARAAVSTPTAANSTASP